MGNNFLRKMKFISIAALAILSVQAEDAAKTCGETFKVELFTDKGCVTADTETDTTSYSGMIAEQACTTVDGADVDALCTGEGFVATKYTSTDGTCKDAVEGTDTAPNPVKAVEWG